MNTSEKLNDMKNQSLYASQVGQDFFKPSELINDQTAMACVSRARELLQIYQMFYSAINELTGMTEVGLRSCVEMPVFQYLFQELGSITDLSNLPLANKQQSMTDMTTFLNNPIFQPFFAQFSSTMEQDLQSLNQTQNQTHQDRQEAL